MCMHLHNLCYVFNGDCECMIIMYVCGFIWCVFDREVYSDDDYGPYGCIIGDIFEQKLNGREGETERSWRSWKRAVVSKPELHLVS